MRNGILFGIAVGMFATAWVGCGSVDDPGKPGPPLWTLTGKITNIPEGLEVRHPRVAFLWVQTHRLRDIAMVIAPFMPVDALVSQDIPLDPEFPATFTLDFIDLPPETAMNDLEDLDESLTGLDLRVAVGILLVYDDRNFNGGMDLLDDNAQESLDHVLGPPKKEQIMAIYLQGDPTGLDKLATSFGMSFERGFNLFCPGDEGLWHPRKVPIIDGEVAISLVDDPALQSYMCLSPNTLMKSHRQVSLGLVNPCVIPANATVTCSSDDRSVLFSHTTSERTGGICRPFVRQTEVVGSCRIEPDQPTPKGWPCER